MVAPEPADMSSGELPEETGDHSRESFRLLLLGAIGVVYGDIGTSPIYAFREALHAAAGRQTIVDEDIYGIISLIFWALVFVVAVKYVAFVLRADNRGEGGILSLMALVRAAVSKGQGWVLGAGVVGVSLFFGDAVITPAVSVLSAVEGLEIVAPHFEAFVVPITVGVLIALFAAQRFGTSRVAVIFGPVTLVWFLALGFFGVMHIFDDTSIFLALGPWYAAYYILDNPAVAFVVTGSVFLAVTGAEAIYADLGHFGRRPIVVAWLAVVFPCLVLNYLGQGAFILAHGEAVSNPFYQMLPEWALVPMIVLATLATVIASQAVITGAFSLARQAVQMNILPRLKILHTSEKTSGQIYIPRVNFILAVIVVLLVVGFGRSASLAAAYGVAVTGNMLVTTLLLFIVMIRIWKLNTVMAVLLSLGFLIIDLLFFSANLLKFQDGGWVSVGLALAVAVIIRTWIKGSRYLFDKIHRNEVSFDFILDRIVQDPPPMVPGTAVFLTGDPESAPTALLHSFKHYKVLHENNVLLTVRTASTPRVSYDDRARISQFNERFMLVTLTFGYMEQPNIPRALVICRQLGWKFDIMTTSFFMSRRTVKPGSGTGLLRWQQRIFIFLLRIASNATEYFQIPTGRVVEIGTQVVI